MENKKQNSELLDVLKSIDLSDNKNALEELKTQVTKEELNQNIYEQEKREERKDISYELDEEIAKLASEIECDTDNSKNCSKDSIYNILKIKETIKFVSKYVASSVAIFMILLVWTNYSAYSELAKNYINPDSMKASEKLLYSSILDVNNNNKDLLEKKGNKVESKKEEKNTKIRKKTKINEEDIITISKNKVFHSVDKLVTKTEKTNLDIPVDIVPFENRIIIPKLWKNIPLIDVVARNVSSLKELEQVFMDDLAWGVVRYPGSARPWEEGNSFIFGHSSNFPWVKWKYNDVFVLLNNLNKWDEIITYYKQKKYVYKVKIKSVINPGEVGILKRNKGKKELTLMTCWPIGTTLKRKIVIAELVEPKKNIKK